MKKFKQSIYTCLLVLTCFVISPFIYIKIWKSSEEVKKPADVAPPTVDFSESSVDSADNTQADVQTTTKNDEASLPTEPPPAASPPDSSANFSFVQGDASYFDDALFIGDSRTVGIQEYGYLNNADYFCSVGMMASKIDDEYINGMNFDTLIDSKQYGKIYLMLGINECGNDFEYTFTQYRAVVERLKVHQPNAIIIIQANLHVAASAETETINNANINYLNSLISGLADNKKVFYVDINELYDDGNGYLTEGYTSDGVHPLAKYYTQWCDWLCSKEISLGEAASSDESANPALGAVSETTENLG